MTKLFKPFAFALMTAIAITSCSKDDDEKDDQTTDPVVKSEVTISGQTYTLQSKGIIENYGADSGFDSTFQYSGTNFDLFLFTEGIKLILDSDGSLDSAYGPGYVLYFESFSSNSSRPADGIYTYDATSPFPVGTFDFGYYTNVDFTDFAEVTGGQYTLSTSGDTYKIVFDLTDSNGEKIEGTFNGKFDIVD